MSAESYKIFTAFNSEKQLEYAKLNIPLKK
jgi:hypothetical protein